MSKQESGVVIFDGQVFQSTAWDRGMGKYSLNLIKSLHSQKEFAGKKSYIVFAKKLTLEAEAKKTIEEICPGSQLVFLDLVVPRVLPGEDIGPIQEANTQILDDFIKSIGASKPDYLILSLLIDQYVAAFPRLSRNMLLFYDLIPLQYSDRYGKMWSYPNYLRRFRTIFKADTIFTISQTVADDLAMYIGIDSRIIKNIDGGPIDRSHIKSVKPKNKIPNKYILMPSGNDLRKNNFKAIQGFEEFRISSGNEDMKLVVTSFFDEKTQNELCKLSDSVIFTGNVNEGELKWLYENTKALLFVSEYEGLGLPILEAAEFDKPIVCSNLTVFNEMSTEAFYYSDQHNPSSIAVALENAVAEVDFKNKKKLYPGIIKKYTWENTSSKLLNFSEKQTFNNVAHNKKRIAVFTPDPDGYSAIGKVVMLSHYALSQHFDIDYFIEEGRSGNSFGRKGYLKSVANTYPSTQFNALTYAKYDAVIYHIGNSEYHLDSIKNALHLPGYLVIHDTRLKEAFEDVMVRYALMDPSRLAAEQALDTLVGTERTTYISSLVAASAGLIVHSEYAEKAINDLQLGSDKKATKLNLPVATPSLRRLKIGSRFSVGFAGIIHKAKGLSIVDKILSLPDFQDVDLYIFGVPLVEPGTLERLESYPNIKIEKNLTDFEFENRLSEMDAVVSYRPNYNGETSLTVVEALRHGVVPVVRDIGWFSELPDEVVEKVDSEDDVIEALKKLINEAEYLEAKKEAGRAYTESRHTYVQYAQGIKDLISSQTPQNLETNIANALRSKQSKDTILKIITSSRATSNS